MSQRRTGREPRIQNAAHHRASHVSRPKGKSEQRRFIANGGTLPAQVSRHHNPRPRSAVRRASESNCQGPEPPRVTTETVSVDSSPFVARHNRLREARPDRRHMRMPADRHRACSFSPFRIPIARWTLAAERAVFAPALPTSPSTRHNPRSRGSCPASSERTCNWLWRSPGTGACAPVPDCRSGG